MEFAQKVIDFEFSLKALKCSLKKKGFSIRLQTSAFQCQLRLRIRKTAAILFAFVENHSVKTSISPMNSVFCSKKNDASFPNIAGVILLCIIHRFFGLNSRL